MPKPRLPLAALAVALPFAAFAAPPRRAAAPPKPALPGPALGKTVSKKAPAPAPVRSAALKVSPLSAAWEKEVVEVVGAGRGRINYEAGVVKAVGLGALAPPSLSKTRSQRVLDAREAALADGLRNLTITTSRVRVTADTRVANYLLRSDEVRVRVDGIIKGADVIEEKLLPTSGLYRIVIQMPMNGPGSLAEALGVEKPATPPKRTARAVKVAAARPVPIATPAPEPTPDPWAPGAAAPPDAEYSSLIVDCRGLRVSATMSPRLFDSDGREVYGTVKVSPDYAIETGIVSYPRSMEYARRTSRTGDRPLIVRARGVADRFRFCPVISDRDADRVRAANHTSRFFERTAVIFLLDADS